MSVNTQSDIKLKQIDSARVWGAQCGQAMCVR